MTTMTQVVGSAVAEWDEEAPLCWTISESLGTGKHAELRQHRFDLTPLLPGHSRDFLLALKASWIELLLQMKAVTISRQAYSIQLVLKAVQDEFMRMAHGDTTTWPIFNQIDSDLITGLWAVQSNLARSHLTVFKTFHKNHRHNSAIFQPGLYPSDFPTGGRVPGDSGHLGCLGRLRKNVLASALSRATLVQILNVTETAYETNELPLGIYAYSRLLLSRAARPESFRLLRLKDLQIDETDSEKNYFLNLTIPKARTAERPQAIVRLHHDVGMILDRQRDAVAERLGNLINKRNATLSESNSLCSRYTIGDLPLFPAGPSSGRMEQKTKDRLGLVGSSEDLTTYYVKPLKTLTSAKLNHQALRHTIGTQLAIAGCSAATIASVLLHASRQTAGIYVDLIFSGAIDELSDSLEPAFLEHFPVIKEFVSVSDLIDPAKRVVSPSSEGGTITTTGECNRHQICQYAPIACYECPRFKPCYDVDHSINLERIMEEVESARGGGLPRQADMARYMHIANRIRLVMNICEAKRETINAEITAAARSK